MKELNEAAKATAKETEEALEGRPMTEGKRDQKALAVAQDAGKRLTGLEAIRKAAERDGATRFTSLLHHLTEEQLRKAYKELNRKSATGVDGVTWQEYGQDLGKKLADLHRRVHEGSYRAQPSKRVYLQKPDGRKRPVGMAVIEDKVVQQGLGTILNEIYEVDFLGYSYGFRPGRSAHNALDAVYVGITQRKVNWILDADIKGFFDNLDHGILMGFLERRIADPRVLRLIRKWLRAGVSEDGEWSKTEVGTPQGAVISPLMANIYLHYALDQWVAEWRTKHAKGEVIFVRYADDFVVGFQHQKDAQNFQNALQEQMGKHGLQMHEDKTRLIEFGRYAKENRKARGEGKPETFDFLGFTHYCATRWKNGSFMVGRKTITKRMHRKMGEIKAELRRQMHREIAETGAWLSSVLRGIYNYAGVPGNYEALKLMHHRIATEWLRVLRRRSQKGRRLTWETFSKIIALWLPKPKITHPYPSQRLCVRYPR